MAHEKNPFAHTYLFLPGRWSGEGKLSIIGGATEQVTLHTIVSHSGAGTITAHMEVNFERPTLTGGVEMVYTIDLHDDVSFAFMQYNSQLGNLTGDGTVTEQVIMMHYHTMDGIYDGEESMTRLSEDSYELRGTLSLNGVPNSVLEASMTRLSIEEV